MKKLLILTIEWPYGSGETFLENEVQFCTGFDAVDCMPFYKIKNSRNVPSHIRIVDSALRFNKIYHLILGICNKSFFQELVFLIKKKKVSIYNIKNLLRCSMMSSYRFQMVKNWLKKQDKEDEITIYTYWMASDAVAVSRLRACGYQIRLFVTRCHRFDLYEYAEKDNYIPYRNLIFENVNQIMAISKEAINYLKQTYNDKYRNKYMLSRLGTSEHGLNPPKADNSNMTIIVSCSNMIEVKRIDLIIKALFEVSHEIKWIHFGDGTLRNQLEELASELPDHITYEFMGRVQNEQLMKWYVNNHVDLFINTSESEGIPVSIMEAMSFGIPVLATDVGGTREIVKDSINGMLLDKRISSKKLANLIDELLDDKYKLNKMSFNARMIWENEFNADKNYKKFYDALKR